MALDNWSFTVKPKRECTFTILMLEEAANTHLVEPLPLVRDNDLDETGNDAGEINIAYNL